MPPDARRQTEMMLKRKVRRCTASSVALEELQDGEGRLLTPSSPPLISLSFWLIDLLFPFLHTSWITTEIE